MAGRDHVRRLLAGEIGTLRAIDVVTGDSRPFAGGILEDLTFRLSDGTEAPAYLLRPPGAAAVPVILYRHAHGGRYVIGRDELTDGRPALTGPYAPDLPARGCAVLCFEMPCFGARSGISESAEAKSRLWRGTTLFGRMLAEQVATLGLSMGGRLAWWLAAIDPRIRAAAGLCCFADMGRLIEAGAHDGHGNYKTVPRLLVHASTGQGAGLAASRPRLHCVGLADWSTPEPCFAAARRDVAAAHAEAGAPDAVEFHVETEIGHAETPAMRARALDFLGRRLSGRPPAPG